MKARDNSLTARIRYQKIVQVVGLIPGHGGRISMEVKCKNAGVLKFRCMIRNSQVYKIYPEPTTMASLKPYCAVSGH